MMPAMPMNALPRGLPLLPAATPRSSPLVFVVIRPPRSKGTLGEGTPGRRCQPSSAPAHSFRAASPACLQERLLGVVGRAHERARDHLEPERAAVRLEPGELGGRPVARDRQLARGGPQILADRDDLAARCLEIAQRALEFFACLAEADHQPGLRDHPAAVRGDAADHLERPPVAPLAAHRRVQALHRLDVVVVHVGTGGDDRVHGRHVRPEVGGEDLHGGARVELLQLGDHNGEVGGAAVREVVAVHRGDDDVLEPHRHRGRSTRTSPPNSPAPRPAVRDRAVAARARADVAHDQERRGAAGEALAAVRAARLVAHGVQPAAAHHAADFVQRAEVELALADPDRQRDAAHFARLRRGPHARSAVIGIRLLLPRWGFYSPGLTTNAPPNPSARRRAATRPALSPSGKGPTRTRNFPLPAASTTACFGVKPRATTRFLTPSACSCLANAATCTQRPGALGAAAGAATCVFAFSVSTGGGAGGAGGTTVGAGCGVGATVGTAAGAVGATTGAAAGAAAIISCGAAAGCSNRTATPSPNATTISSATPAISAASWRPVMMISK